MFTHTVTINIQLYQSIYLTHLQAISSTVKLNNRSTETEKKNTQKSSDAKKKKKKPTLKQLWSNLTSMPPLYW